MQIYIYYYVSFRSFVDARRRQNTFASWGDYDRNQFKRQCDREVVPYPFSTTHLKVKNLFALKYKLDKEVGMIEALQLSKLEHTGIHHRGFYDSLNISNLLIHLINS